MVEQMLGILGAGFAMPPEASSVSGNYDRLFSFILWVCVFFFLLVSVLLVIFVIKFRHREGVKTDTSAGHSTALELTWTIIPTILVLIMFYYGFQDYLNMAVEPPGAMEITVQAQTWAWHFTYPNGAGDPELWVPVNKPVRLIMSSSDVIHSFFVPAFRIKKDVVPGRFNRIWFEATKPGTYQIFCAEYCGKDHSRMLSKVHVVSEEEWNKRMTYISRWDDKLSPIDAGRKFYETMGCKGCHSIDGTKGTGPSLKDVFGSTVALTDGKSVVADDNYVHESLLDPAAKVVAGFTPQMPSFRGQLSGQDIYAISSFLKSISANYKGDLEPLKKIKPLTPVAQPATQPAAGN